MILLHIMSVIIFMFYTTFVIGHKDLTSDIQIKFYIENFLFIGLLLLSINIPIIVFVYVKNKKIIVEFDKIIEFSKLHTFSEQHQSLKELDIIGTKTIELFKRINDLSNKRIIKLSSLYEIINHLTINTDKFILILNVVGDILYVSSPLEKKLNTNKILLQTLDITEVISINYKSLLIELDNSRTIIQKDNLEMTNESSKLLAKKADFYPIFNSEHNLSNVILYLEF